jgi:TonB family protein
MKWAAGAAAAAVLLGGGYYAWKTYAPAPAVSEVAADNTTSFDTALSGAPEYSEARGGDAAVKSDLATAGAADDAKASDAKAQKAKPRVAAAVIPEQTIGVSRAGARANQTDDLVVTGTRRPVWRSTPSAERLSSCYPSSALERGREGEASLQCTVKERGLLSCVSVSETPARQGFGRAAIQVAHTFRHAPKRADGRDALGTPVNLRVLFRMADSDRRG